MQPYLSQPKYRADIDGLRAIAVLSIVIFHAFPSLVKGGFIGVDVFFVISGFLISTIIFENLDRGTFSFVEFYVRRIKRIFPALLLVLVACYVFGWFALLAEEYKQLGKHIAAGAGFFSNFGFWSEAGYFDNLAEIKPLLHLWSLGIEEQFYIVWPVLLWLAWKMKLHLLKITICVAALSLYLNLTGIKTDPVATFYSPQTRFWEILFGCLLAWAMLYKRGALDAVHSRLTHRLTPDAPREKPGADSKTLTNTFSLLGLLLLCYGFGRINNELGFPGIWAVFPVLGTTLIILAGPNAWLNHHLLSNRILVWFGLISFPLYLWHWPMLSFARIIEGDALNDNVRIAMVALSVLLAWLTYLVVERPVRLAKRSGRKAIALAVLMAVVGVVGHYTERKNGLSFRNRILEDNLKKFSWPESKNRDPECIKKFGGLFTDYCLISNPKKDPEIILLGDSNANHFYEGLKAVFGDKNFLMIGQGGCLPFVGLTVKMNQIELECDRELNPALELIKSNRSVKTVIISMQGQTYVNGQITCNGDTGFLEVHEVGKNEPRDRLTLFEEGMRRTLKLLLDERKKVVFILSIPRLSYSLSECMGIRPLLFSAKPSMSQCAMPKEEYLSDSNAYIGIVTKVLKDFPTVKVFDPSAVLCDEKNCYAEKDGQVLYRDDRHLSSFGSLYMGRAIKQTRLVSD
ncbi:MAG: acyltransferase family protein [Bacteriovoracia bacterium]